ncbi:venom acid phosphatase Acph-1 isoform X2 [Monomorium pharaonis]|uniref:venom acid phosphatase Acph-1 isoform X2 n=1 Tax=Monomorium pharaonis TaxID=307658 RepID=UPI00063FB94D|nr:venom acid phosphatase Acph-1 isoform X2 [Monomorium pharaonis]
MTKFQRIIVLMFYFCLLTTLKTEALIISTRPTTIYTEDDLKLRLVNVFRHGDRTTDKNYESYPNDPYKNNDFYPDGDGQLTNVGKNRSYALGLWLRDKYNSFLGDMYYPPNVYARSTEMSRCKMTLQLVLAALYPPVDRQKWNEKLSWQPIDLIYTSRHEDNLLNPSFACPIFQKIYENQLQSPEVKKKIEEFNDLMADVSKHTGKNITSVRDLALIYHTLYIESFMGLPLPKWTKNIFPNGTLLNAVYLDYELFNYNELNNLNGGVLLNRIINDMNKVINKTLPDRRINLFSAHDVNVVGLLYALNISVIFRRHFPTFTSSVIVELYEDDGEYLVKVLYYLGIPSEIREINIPGCEVLCPYNKFVELTKSTTALKGVPLLRSGTTSGTGVQVKKNIQMTILLSSFFLLYMV